MNIKELFQQLNQKLDQLQQKVAQPNTDEKQIEIEIEELKMNSEEIVEEWLKFENKLGQFLHQHMMQSQIETNSGPEPSVAIEQQEQQMKQLYEQWYESWADEKKNKQLSYKLEDGSEEWKKGKALYDLLMFEDAIPHLEMALTKDPDFEAARLFLAHSYIATDQREKATYQLHFLCETSARPDIRHLGLHGLACLAGALKQYERSLQYFEKIDLDEVRSEWLPIFISNYAVTLFELQEYNACLEQWKKYYLLAPDDWRGPYMLGQVCLALGAEETALAFWFEALQIEEHLSLLKAMAKHFESKAYHGMAAQCYTRILQNRCAKDDVESWFGLAWNQGLAQQREQAEASFIKALSLFPTHIELQIAYTWMLLYWKDRQKSLKSILALQQVQRDHPLVLGLTYLYEGKFGEALDVLEAHTV